MAVEGMTLGEMMPLMESNASALGLILSVVSGVLAFFLLSWPGKKREERLEKSNAYVQLELASLEIFRFKAEHWYEMRWAFGGENPETWDVYRLEEVADQYFYQCLNLFEIASRLRKVKVIEPQVYASWVAWFYETLEFRHFRSRWASTYKDNYTPEVQAIFDAGMTLNWEGGLDEDSMRKDFYAKVALAVECDEIEKWRVAIGDQADQSEPTSPNDFSFAWDRGESADEAARFAAPIIGAQPSYISHGEIQCGLTSAGGSAWIDNLEERYAHDFASPGAREMLIARNSSGEIAGIAILHPELEGTTRYGTLEDMTVAPKLRSAGLGNALIERVVARARELDCEWVFLESGLGNERAHHFFERAGFNMISHTFAKRL